MRSFKDFLFEKVKMPRYLGMIGISKSDLGIRFRKKVNATLGLVMETDMTSERLINPSKATIANAIVSDLEGGENIIYLIKSMDEENENRTNFIAISNIRGLAKRFDMSIGKLQEMHTYIFFNINSPEVKVEQVDGKMTSLVDVLEQNTLSKNFVHKLVLRSSFDGDALIPLGVSSSEDDDETHREIPGYEDESDDVIDDVPVEEPDEKKED